MGEKPSPLGEDFSFIVDAAARTQGKAGMVFSLDPSNPWILGPQAFGFSRRVLTLYYNFSHLREAINSKLKGRTVFLDIVFKLGLIMRIFFINLKPDNAIEGGTKQ